VYSHSNLCLKKVKRRQLSFFIQSCGLAKIPVYDELDKSKARHGAGMSADVFIKANPLVPTEDEGRLNDSRIRENFIARVFSF
jgi:uncharacterized protein YbbK (DUF523 family)